MLIVPRVRIELPTQYHTEQILRIPYLSIGEKHLVNFSLPVRNDVETFLTHECEFLLKHRNDRVLPVHALSANARLYISKTSFRVLTVYTSENSAVLTMTFQQFTEVCCTITKVDK